MLKILITVIALVAIIVSSTIATSALAVTNITPDNSGSATLKDPLGLEGVKNAPQQLIGRIISAALGIVGSLALLMFVYGGLLWMTSGGNDEKVKQGREILIWATAGLALVFFSYVLVRFVIGGLIGGELPGVQQTGPTQQELEDTVL